MPRIVKLEISNFRGISSFDACFPMDRNIVCLAGRGDSGKTTILDAISLALSPVWNVQLTDADFFNCDIESAIEIRATLIGLPIEILTENKFGMHKRYVDADLNVIDEALQFEGDGIEALTIKLKVDKTLEPLWSVTTERAQEDKPISAFDRRKISCFMVSDYVDRHFSWAKGSPLHSLLNTIENSERVATGAIFNEAVRGVKQSIDAQTFPEMEAVTQKLHLKMADVGVDVSDLSTALDIKDIAIRDGRLSLHEDVVPLRMLGKGSKRLLSIAIQLSVANNGGIVLIDELEQGLEPDRAKHVARLLKEEPEGQIFLTTHSAEVIRELEARDISIVAKNMLDSSVAIIPLPHSNAMVQGTIRRCPEAFFARRVIVCEGATEVGVCRALEIFRLRGGKPPMAYSGVAWIDGTGSSFADRARVILGVNLDVAIFCDSDEDNANDKKPELRSIGAKIFDTDNGNSIEDQVFADLPWDAVLKLVSGVSKSFGYSDQAIDDQIKGKYSGQEAFPNDWREADSPDIRKALSSASTTGKEWFKTISRGWMLGEVVFSNFDKMVDTRLGNTLSSLSEWVDSE